MLFTRARDTSVEKCLGAHATNDFWPESIIAALPCNHTPAVCFPLEQAGTRPLGSLYWDGLAQGAAAD